MREIKFRAWEKDTGTMWDVRELVWGGGEIMSAYLGLHEAKAENMQLMQYTGLKDKNGKEIFEGDVVDIEHEICRVIFNAPNFAAYNSKNHEWNIQYAGLEIIGNIHENPELLKN